MLNCHSNQQVKIQEKTAKRDSHQGNMARRLTTLLCSLKKMTGDMLVPKGSEQMLGPLRYQEVLLTQCEASQFKLTHVSISLSLS